MSAGSGRSGYVVAAGLLVSLAGGWWLGLVLLVLASPSRQLLDAGALIAAVAALCGAYSLVGASGPALSKPHYQVAGWNRLRFTRWCAAARRSPGR